jgi:IS5 family transposase
MVRLARHTDGAAFEKALASMWHDSNGRPSIDTRLMVSLHYLKYTFDLSDEAVVEGWVQNPYWQFLSGMRYFEHEMPLDACDQRP